MGIDEITPFYKYLLCVMVTILVAFLFFQFVQKPKIIKQVCEQQAIERSVANAPESKISNVQQRDTVQTNLQKKQYDTCMILNGANP